MRKGVNKIQCPICKQDNPVQDGEFNCSNCKTPLKYEYHKPIYVLNTIAPIHTAYVFIDNEWRPFLLPPKVNEKIYYYLQMRKRAWPPQQASVQYSRRMVEKEIKKKYQNYIILKYEIKRYDGQVFPFMECVILI